MTRVSNALRATVASAEAFELVIVEKLVSSISGNAPVCSGTRPSDTAFVVAIGIIAVALAAAYHFKHCQ